MKCPPFITCDHALDQHTSFHIGGKADYFAEPCNREQLSRAVTWAGDHGLPWFVLGGGTNTLMPDSGYPGLVISMAAYADEEFREVGERGLLCLPGTPLRRVIHASLKRGWSGLESFVGIPGTIGGAVYGNAGSRGHSMSERVVRVLLLSETGELEWVPGDAIPWAYRNSGIGARVIAEIELGLEPGDRTAIAQAAKELFNLKRETQPLQAWSAGCVFRNPPGEFAGELIERAGLKGQRQGGAVVSPRHANFIVNEGAATAADVTGLIARIQAVVREQFGVQLQREIVSPRLPGPDPEGRLKDSEGRPRDNE